MLLLQGQGAEGRPHRAGVPPLLRRPDPAAQGVGEGLAEVGIAAQAAGEAHRPLSPRRPVAVDRLYSVHYFEWPISYAYSGESHDFWELLYVDKGAVEVTAGDRRLRLDQGQIIFHPPGEFHAFSAAGAAPDLVVVGFDCVNPAMAFFRNRITSLLPEERALLGRVVAVIRRY